MRRIHGFEFNELDWCPEIIRTSIVEILGNGQRWGRIYDPMAPVFADFCRRAKCETVLDLCSGSGEPAGILIDALKRQGIPSPRFIISDLFPNIEAMNRSAARHPGLIQVNEESVNATNVPPSLKASARTIISAFHHFPPTLAADILADCVAQRQALFILEGFPRSFRRFLAFLPFLTIAFCVNPFLTKKHRILKFIFTFIIPVIALLGLWDGITSSLRVHTKDEMMRMAAPLGDHYQWAYHETPFFPGGRAVAFWGIPKDKTG